MDATAIVDVAGTMEMQFRFTECPYTEKEINFMGALLYSYVRNKSLTPESTGPTNTIHIDQMAYRLKRSEGAFLTLADFEARSK